MATDKLFTVAGVSTLNGDTKPRFANDMTRVKILAKNGHEDIELVELPSAMTKVQAVEHLSSLADFASFSAVLGDYLAEHGSKTTVKTPKATKAKSEVKTPSIDAIKARAKTKATPQVPALDGMTPLGFKEVEAAVGLAPYMVADEDKPFGVA